MTKITDKQKAKIAAAITANIVKVAESMTILTNAHKDVPAWEQTRDTAILIAQVNDDPAARVTALRDFMTAARKSAELADDAAGVNTFKQLTSSVCASWTRPEAKQRDDHDDGTPRAGEGVKAYRDRCGAKAKERGTKERNTAASAAATTAPQASKDDPTKDDSAPAPAAPFQREVGEIAARATLAGKGVTLWQYLANAARDWEKMQAATPAATEVQPATKPAGRSRRTANA